MSVLSGFKPHRRNSTTLETARVATKNVFVTAFGASLVGATVSVGDIAVQTLNTVAFEGDKYISQTGVWAAAATGEYVGVMVVAGLARRAIESWDREGSQ